MMDLRDKYCDTEVSVEFPLSRPKNFSFWSINVFSNTIQSNLHEQPAVFCPADGPHILHFNFSHKIGL